MNTSPVISGIVAADLSSYGAHVNLKLTSTGWNIAGAGDRVLGAMLHSNIAPQVGQSAVGMACTVFLKNANGLHNVTVGNATAIAMGDELEQFANGRVAKLATRTLAGTSAASDDIIDLVAHGYVDGQEVIWVTKSGGTGIVLGQTYYVINAAADTFQLAATPGGAAVDLATDITAGTFKTKPAYVAYDSAPASSTDGIIRAIPLP